MWSRLKGFSLPQKNTALVFLLFAAQLVSQSWSSIVSNVGKGLGRIVAVVVVNGGNSSVVVGRNWGSVVIGSHNWSSHGNGLLVNVGLSRNLDINIGFSRNLNMHVGFSSRVEVVRGHRGVVSGAINSTINS